MVREGQNYDPKSFCFYHSDWEKEKFGHYHEFFYNLAIAWGNWKLLNDKHKNWWTATGAQYFKQQLDGSIGKQSSNKCSARRTSTRWRENKVWSGKSSDNICSLWHSPRYVSSESRGSPTSGGWAARYTISHFRFMPILIMLLILLTVFVLTYSCTVYLTADARSSYFFVALLAPLLSLSKVPTALEKMTSPSTFTAASSPPPLHRSLSCQSENTNSSKYSEPLLTVDDEAQPLAECTGIRRRTAWSTTY